MIISIGATTSATFSALFVVSLLKKFLKNTDILLFMATFPDWKNIWKVIKGQAFCKGQEMLLLQSLLSFIESEY
jgi:hypothetical protein